MKNGIDISENNDSVNWVKVKKSGVDFAWIRSSLGMDYTDPLFKKHVEQARLAQIKTGLYHFATLNSNHVLADATHEANLFLSKLNEVAFDICPVIDLEENGEELSPSQVHDWVSTFKNIVEAWLITYRPESGIQNLILYSYTTFLDNYLPKGIDMPLWLAQYTTREAPVLPNGWIPDKYPDRKLVAWQWSNKGKVPGISGDVDLDRIFVDEFTDRQLGRVSTFV